VVNETIGPHHAGDATTGHASDFGPLDIALDINLWSPGRSSSPWNRRGKDHGREPPSGGFASVARSGQDIVHFWFAAPVQLHSWSRAPSALVLPVTSTHLFAAGFTRSLVVEL
jgi:hypothetical protein